MSDDGKTSKLEARTLYADVGMCSRDQAAAQMEAMRRFIGDPPIVDQRIWRTGRGEWAWSFWVSERSDACSNAGKGSASR